MCIYTYFCNRLHLIKICLCSFLDIHLYSNSLSTIAMTPLFIMLEFFPACLSCNNISNLLHNSSGLSE